MTGSTLGATVVIGTRSSALARWQANRVKTQLESRGLEARLEEITTTGDRELGVPLSEIGDEAVFTRELDLALLGGEIDCAVHSLKDLPTSLPEGLTIAAISERESPWDVFVAGPDFSGALEELPENARLATSALRRRAQLKAWRPDLEIVPIRGNVDTRLEKLAASSWDGMVLAEAGLVRLGLEDAIRERFTPDRMLPAVGQGALGVACLRKNEKLADVLRESVEDPDAAAATRAERAMLHRMEGGCQVPIGAWGRIDGEGRLLLDGTVATLDGERIVRQSISGRPDEPEALGVHLAEYLLHEGGEDILQEVRRQAAK